MLSNRIAHQTLSTLCERVGVAFDVGLDPHRVFEREAESNDALYAKKMLAVAEHVRRGGSLAEAVKAQGNYFPVHFADMIEAGEKSGRLELVLERLAEYYQDLAEMRSTFMNSILWPMVQVALAVLVVAMLIYLPELLAKTTDEQIDLLGIGLIGASGLRTYFVIVAFVAFGAFVLYQLARNGFFDFLTDWAARVPTAGKVVRVFPETRFVEALSMAVYSGISAWSAADMGFRSANTPQYLSKAPAAKDAILQGRELHKVMADTELFQNTTLDAVELGEKSGRLAEILDKHLRHLRSQVKSSMTQITYFASSVVWVLVAALLIMIIIRVFSMYVGVLEGAVETAVGG